MIRSSRGDGNRPPVLGVPVPDPGRAAQQARTQAGDYQAPVPAMFPVQPVLLLQLLDGDASFRRIWTSIIDSAFTDRRNAWPWNRAVRPREYLDVLGCYGKDDADIWQGRC